MMKENNKNVKKLTLYENDYALRKYNLLKFINHLTADESFFFKKEIYKKINITRVTFNSWLNIHKEDTAEIPSYKLAILAKTLNKTIEECFNISIKPIEIYEEVEDISTSTSSGLV